MQPGALYFAAFLKRPPDRPGHPSPLPAATNTGATATLAATARDYLCRDGFISYRLDRVGTFNSPSLQTSPAVATRGDRPASWTSTPLGNGTWYWQAAASGFSIGAGPAPAAQAQGAPTRAFTEQFGALYRAMEFQANRAVQAPPVTVGTYRALTLIDNRAIWALAAPTYRALTLLDARGIQALRVLARALELLESYDNTALFPWLLSVSPTQQYRGGQVNLYGDGFGDTAGALASSVLLGAALREPMGVVAWQSRSPGLWPCNAVDPNVFSPAIIVTVPGDAVSGTLLVEETA